MNSLLISLQSVLLNIYWVSALFVALAVLFHVTLIHQRQLKLKQWKQVEYIWVLLAFISTLGVIDESRRLNAQLQITQDESTVMLAGSQVSNWFDNYHRLHCQEQYSKEKCQAFEQMNTDLGFILDDLDESGGIPLAILAPLDKVELILNEQALSAVKQRIASYNNARDNYLLTVVDAQRSWFRLLFSALTPLLLACALALKLTKVTAEYRAYSKEGK